MEFDLKGFAESLPTTSSNRVGRWIGVATIILFGFIAAIALEQYCLSKSGLPGGADGLIGVLLICAFFIFVGIRVYRITAPAPDSLRVDSEGLVFRYSSGRPTRVRWSQHGLRLNLDRTDGYVRHGIPIPPQAQLAKGFASPSTRLPPQAFAEIVNQARSVGLTVTEGPSGSPHYVRVIISNG